MAARFEMNPHFEKEVQASDGVRDFLANLVPDIARDARELVAVDTGDLRDSIEGEVGTSDRGGHMGRVVAKDFKAAWEEFGTSRQSERPFLRPAAEAAGLHLEKD